MRDIHDPQSIEAIDAHYLSDMLCNHHQKEDIEVLTFETEQMKPGFLTGIAGGLIRYVLTCRSKDEDQFETSLVLKAGTGTDKMLGAAYHFLGQLGYHRLVEIAHEVLSQWFGKGPSINEILTLRDLLPQIPIATPIIYHTILDEKSERLWIFMQDLSDHLLIEHPSDGWTPDLEDAVVHDVARMHAEFWNMQESKTQPDWLESISSKEVAYVIPYLQESLNVFGERHGDKIESKHLTLLERVLEHFELICSFLTECDQTLVHGDFHRGNICFHPKTQDPVVYDWGNTRIDVPQIDLYSFIAQYRPDQNLDRANVLIDVYLEALSGIRSVQIDRADFMHVFNFQLCRMLMRKMPLSLLLKEPDAGLLANLAWVEHAIDDVLS